jgi:hypothetical protein
MGSKRIPMSERVQRKLLKIDFQASNSNFVASWILVSNYSSHLLYRYTDIVSFEIYIIQQLSYKLSAFNPHTTWSNLHHNLRN